MPNLKPPGRNVTCISPLPIHDPVIESWPSLMIWTVEPFAPCAVAKPTAWLPWPVPEKKTVRSPMAGVRTAGDGESLPPR